MMNATKNQNGTELTLNFSGKVDEDADFSKLDISTAGSLVLNLENIQTINSCGIREWIKWIRTAPSTAQIVYEKCPKVIVDQINMVDGFLPANGSVRSFYVPYYNEESGSEKSVLFIQGQHFNGNQLMPPPEVKDADGNVMEIDVIEAKFFKFLEKNR